MLFLDSGLTLKSSNEGASMLRNILGICLALAVTAANATAGDVSPAQANLSAAAIVDKNVAARGGLQAWRAVQTLSLAGKMGAGGNQRATLPTPSPLPGRKFSQQMLPQRPTEEVQLPFLMEFKRSRKMRLELQFRGQTAIQVFDGSNGWKLRPFLNRMEVEPYTPEELKMASAQSDLDGFLVDYAAKGTQVELTGTEKVEGRDTYNLKLTMKNGQTIHVWVDAETFLETKVEGQPRRLDGAEHPVEVYYRDYRAVDGLQIPFVLETRVIPVAKTATGMRDTPVPPEKVIVDKVVVNPKLDEKLFSKPEVGLAPNTK
jgi:hypothetical protein